MIDKRHLPRIVSALVMITLILWGYWWITWSLAIILLFVFKSYYEIIVWGIVYDALYGLTLLQFSNIPLVFSISSIILFLIFFFLRRNLLIYEES